MGMMVCFHVPFVELTNIIPSQYHYERCKRGYRQVKVGIIRCRQTEDMCPGTTDFKIAASGACAFEDMGPVDIVGFLSCGGCPGKRAVLRAKMLVDRGAEAVVFASCMKKGNPIDFPCPHFSTIKAAVEKQLRPEIKVIDWTH